VRSTAKRARLRRMLGWPAVLLVALELAAVAKPREIAVMETTADGGADPQIGAQISARLADLVGKRPGVHVIAPDDIRALLEKDAKRQLLGCDGESCLTEIVGALGADLVIKARVSKIEDGYAVSMNAVDAHEAKAISHVTETWKGESIALLELVAPMVDKLLSEAPEKLAGAVDASGARSGSQILIDDQVRGTAPAGQMGGVPIGAHRLRVVLEGYGPFERWIVVKTNEIVTVPVEQKELPSSPFYATWWFWTGTAAVIVGGGVAAAFLLKGSGSGSGAGATGVAVSVNANDAFRK
jgi:PEGA domain-containing protein